MKKSYKISIMFLQVLLISILVIAFKIIVNMPYFTIRLHANKKMVNYTEVPKSALSSKNDLILVNKSHALSKNYIPGDLYKPKVRFYHSAKEEEKYMEKDAAIALEELFKNAHKDGIELYGLSGFRSYSTQKASYTKACLIKGRNEADKQVAKAGLSEHQTGLAMDVTNKAYSPSFEITKEGKWLYKNCYKAGFILRYPLNKQSVTGYNYEPWHIRYVGKVAAQEIFSKKIVLEEYLKK